MVTVVASLPLVSTQEIIDTMRVYKSTISVFKISKSNEGERLT